MFRLSRDPRRRLVSGGARGIFCFSFYGLTDTTSFSLSFSLLIVFLSSSCLPLSPGSRPSKSIPSRLVSLLVLCRVPSRRPPPCPSSFAQPSGVRTFLTSACCRCHRGLLKHWPIIFTLVFDNRWDCVYSTIGLVCSCVCIRVNKGQPAASQEKQPASHLFRPSNSLVFFCTGG